MITDTQAAWLFIGVCIVVVALCAVEAWRTQRRVARTLAQLRRTQAEIEAARAQPTVATGTTIRLAPRHSPPPAAPGLRLSPSDVARPLPRALRHQGDRLIIVARVRRPRNN